MTMPEKPCVLRSGHRRDSAIVEVVNPSLMADQRARTEALMPYDVIVAMRERTVFSRDIIKALSNLKLLITTGMRNNSIDLVAARERDLDVCGTQMVPYAAFEHAWALLISVAKNIPAEHNAMINGEWQRFIGGTETSERSSFSGMILANLEVV